MTEVIEILATEMPACFILGSVLVLFGQLLRNALGRG